MFGNQDGGEVEQEKCALALKLRVYISGHRRELRKVQSSNYT